MNPCIAPPLREPGVDGHTMVYNPSIQKVVLFNSVAQTWTYDYSTNIWEQQFPDVSPSSRSYHGMIYDTTRQEIILMGGSSVAFETWEMDATTFNWTNLSPVTPIQSLFVFSLSYDQANDKIIIFGGQNSTSLNTGETYSFDYSANEWNLLNPLVDPSDRRFYDKPMGYDVQSQKSIFYGGRDLTTTYNSTWTFDYSTTTWTIIPTINTPLAIWIHTMVFNSQTNKFIMFGGNDQQFGEQQNNKITIF